MRHKITFDQFDEPVLVHLRFAQGKVVDNPFDPDWRSFQYMFSAEEGVFYLSDTAGGLLNARLRSRGVRPGEPVTITKCKVPNANSARPITEYFPRRCVELMDAGA